jgi:predicted Zn-dependent protease
MKLTHNADLTHEDARGWYDSYGWYITTENEGDVTIDAVEYDWLDGTDTKAVAKLRETYDALTDDEAESIVAKARKVRETGETVEGLLDEAVEAYQRGDVDAAVKALDEVARVESEHGDSPAANSLRSQLLDDSDEVE